MKRPFTCLLLLLTWVMPLRTRSNSRPPNKQTYSAYLFAYFTGNDKKDEAIRFALSSDGYRYVALNGNQPVLSSAAISETGGVRDPHILRGADGKTLYMVATDMVSAKGWDSNRAMVLLRSTNLVNWTSSKVNLQKKYAGQENLKRVWAPQTIYDAKAGKYMVYFSLKYGQDADKIYYAYANKDFTDLEGEPKQLFFSSTNGSCIDGDIVTKDGKFYLFFKTEGQGAGIKIAVSDQLTGGYVLQDRYVQQTKDPVEGAGTFKLNNSDDYILMYDLYTTGKYQFTRTRDLQNFAVVDHAISMNFHPRHGTVMPLTKAEARRVTMRWLTPADVLLSAQHPAIRKTRSVVDTIRREVSFAVPPGTDLAKFNPTFASLDGATVVPVGAQDFTQGPVSCTVAVGANKQKFMVHVITQP